MCAARALGFPPPERWWSAEVLIVFRLTLPRTALFLVSAEVLANRGNQELGTWD